jgi:hypothetical protein
MTPSNNSDYAVMPEKEPGVSNLSPEGFKKFVARSEYGIDGQTPAERVKQLIGMNTDALFLFLDDLNAALRGEEGTQIELDKAMNIGTTKLLDPEDRYPVLDAIFSDIKESSETTHPSRVGDVLSLAIVMTHPFKDGNGRTARAISLLFRDEYDSTDFVDDYVATTTSRDELRKRGGVIPYGFVPYLDGEARQDSREHTTAYLQSVLHDSSDTPAYLGTFGYSPARR